MRILSNPNFNFLKWRWHAIALSVDRDRRRHPDGRRARRPAARRGLLGRHRCRACSSRSRPAKIRARRALGPMSVRGRRAAIRPGHQQRDPHPAAARGGRRAGQFARRQCRSASSRRCDRRTSVNSASSTARLVGADDRAGPSAEGHLGDAHRARRHPGLHRRAVPFQLRGGRGRRDVSRHPGHPRVPRPGSATTSRSTSSRRFSRLPATR